jgi:hypothetical protein
MPAHPLDAAFYRITRATEHLVDLQPRISALMLEQQKAAIAHFQAHSREYISHHTHMQLVAPMSVAVRMGEICYNLRTALDYLVFEIAKLDSGTPQDFTQFPIVSSKDKFRFWKKNARSKGINAAHIAAFETLQPYKGCNWTSALTVLLNKDKHREFNELGGTATLVFYTIWGDRDYATLPFPIIRAVHPLTKQEMEMKIEFRAIISFDNGLPVMESLEKIKLGVVETLEMFKPEFER